MFQGSDNPVAQCFLVLQHRASCGGKTLHLPAGHRLELGRAGVAQKLLPITFWQPEYHALLVQAEEQVAIDEATRPAEHLALLDRGIHWSQVTEQIDQLGRQSGGAGRRVASASAATPTLPEDFAESPSLRLAPDAAKLKV